MHKQQIRTIDRLHCAIYGSVAARRATIFATISPHVYDMIRLIYRDPELKSGAWVGYNSK